MTNIVQTNPHSEYLALQEKIDHALLSVARQGQYILGPEVEAFETEFANYIGVPHSVGVASGTDAIELALRTLNIGRGDIVITTSMTAVATAAAIARTGATPLFVDVETHGFNMDPGILESTINAVHSGKYSTLGNKVSAIIAVHLYGHPVDIGSISQIATANDCYLIEDCAQAHGASCKGTSVGSWGDMAAFSFYPTKNLGALGDGGAITTSKTEYFQRAAMLRQYGWLQRQISSEQGINSRLDEIQAAVLRIKLANLDDFVSRRRNTAKLYNQLIDHPAIQKPIEASGYQHAYHQYVIRCHNRDDLVNHLFANGIQTAIHYPMPVHSQPAYKNLPISPEGLQRTELLTREILSLPMWVYLQPEQVERVALAINQWVDSAA